MDLCWRVLVWPLWRAWVIDEASWKLAEANTAKARAAELAVMGLGWLRCGWDGWGLAL
ncbi:MAG TPA: hypothetical protein VGT44_06795 [Ktedonobacteraceae bacterium]|nr:hypothetical protein [Ktedonobacteraceae bacterium]